MHSIVLYLEPSGMLELIIDGYTHQYRRRCDGSESTLRSECSGEMAQIDNYRNVQVAEDGSVTMTL